MVLRLRLVLWRLMARSVWDTGHALAALSSLIWRGIRDKCSYAERTRKPPVENQNGGHLLREDDSRKGDGENVVVVIVVVTKFTLNLDHVSMLHEFGKGLRDVLERVQNWSNLLEVVRIVATTYRCPTNNASLMFHILYKWHYHSVCRFRPFCLNKVRTCCLLTSTRQKVEHFTPALSPSPSHRPFCPTHPPKASSHPPPITQTSPTTPSPH